MNSGGKPRHHTLWADFACIGNDKSNVAKPVHSHWDVTEKNFICGQQDLSPFQRPILQLRSLSDAGLEELS
ncbi:hypothetical protein BK671_00885 [Pseudomonas fluorescens]|uniref:Uncharacterized protein n=1 Tax=Pseudomonas fluorescens TaxID=294 RepID=A0A423LVY3_PSEFL|nr:hypothetical protein BK671_00885 [Pseudomonas fluorescens]